MSSLYSICVKISYIILGLVTHLTHPVVIEQNLQTHQHNIYPFLGVPTHLSKRKTFQNILLRSSDSVQSIGGSSRKSGADKESCCNVSGSTVSWRYSTVLVSEPIIDHALATCPLTICISASAAIDY